MPLRKEFQGIWVESITPFDYQFNIVRQTLLNHYDFLESAGITGIIPLSPMGESPSLTFDEKIQILRYYGEEGTSIKLMPAIIETSLKNAEYFLRSAINAGVDGILLYPPFFYKHIKQSTLYRYYEYLLEIVKQSKRDIPIFFALNDNYTQIPTSEFIIEKLTSKFENIYGLIDYGLDENHSLELKEKFPRLIVLTANENRFQEFLWNGGNGIVSSIANAFPQLINSFYESIKRSACENGRERSIILQQKIKHINDILNKYPFHSAIKYALYQQQFPSIETRLPLEKLKEDQKTVLKNEIKSILGKIKEEF